MNKKEIHQILAAQQKPTLTTLPFVLPRGVAGRRGGSRERGATREATGSGLSARARKKRREKMEEGKQRQCDEEEEMEKGRENIVENS